MLSNDLANLFTESSSSEINSPRASSCCVLKRRYPVKDDGEIPRSRYGGFRRTVTDKPQGWTRFSRKLTLVVILCFGFPDFSEATVGVPTNFTHRAYRSLSNSLPAGHHREYPCGHLTSEYGWNTRMGEIETAACNTANRTRVCMATSPNPLQSHETRVIARLLL